MGTRWRSDRPKAERASPIVAFNEASLPRVAPMQAVQAVLVNLLMVNDLLDAALHA